MGNVYIHFTDIKAAKNIYDLIKVFGYRPMMSRTGDVIKMYSDDYFDMVGSVPFMAMVMDDPLTVTKFIEES